MDLAEPQTWAWIWLVTMVVFGVGEMMAAGSFFLAPFAVGALVAAILAFFEVPVEMQWVVFLGVSAASFLALRPLGRRLDRHRPPRGVGANRLVGLHGRVIEAIGSGHTPGMVVVEAEQWRAESVDGQPIPIGTTVVIDEVRGTRVVVKPNDQLTRSAP